MTTPEQLRKARLDLGLTQPQIAERCRVDVSTVWRWENESIPDRGSARVLIEQIVAEAEAQKTGQAA